MTQKQRVPLTDVGRSILRELFDVKVKYTPDGYSSLIKSKKKELKSNDIDELFLDWVDFIRTI